MMPMVPVLCNDKFYGKSKKVCEFPYGVFFLDNRHLFELKHAVFYRLNEGPKGHLLPTFFRHIFWQPIGSKEAASP